MSDLAPDGKPWPKHAFWPPRFEGFTADHGVFDIGREYPSPWYAEWGRELIAAIIEKDVRSEALQLNRDCELALNLTDYSKWDTLIVVRVNDVLSDHHIAPAVACRWPS